MNVNFSWGIKNIKMTLTLEQIALLKWPHNQAELRSLSISGLQAWYLSQDMRYMVFLGQDQRFKRFIYWNYTLPVRCLRFWYKLKRTVSNG